MRVFLVLFAVFINLPFQSSGAETSSCYIYTYRNKLFDLIITHKLKSYMEYRLYDYTISELNQIYMMLHDGLCEIQIFISCMLS